MVSNASANNARSYGDFPNRGLQPGFYFTAILRISRNPGRISPIWGMEPGVLRSENGHRLACQGEARGKSGAWKTPLFAPRRERFVEGAFAGGALFDRDDGAALVDVDQRHVEPGALLQELKVAGAI